jgi:hypothetical protein
LKANDFHLLHPILVKSTMTCIGLGALTLISPTNLLNHMASLAALVMAIYSASVELSAVQGCFLLHQVIGLDLSRKKYHDTNFQSWTSPT